MSATAAASWCCSAEYFIDLPLEPFIQGHGVVPLSARIVYSKRYSVPNATTAADFHQAIASITPAMTPVEAAVYAGATAFGRGFKARPLSRRQRFTPD